MGIVFSVPGAMSVNITIAPPGGRAVPYVVTGMAPVEAGVLEVGVLEAGAVVVAGWLLGVVCDVAGVLTVGCPLVVVLAPDELQDDTKRITTRAVAAMKNELLFKTISPFYEISTTSENIYLPMIERITCNTNK